MRFWLCCVFLGLAVVLRASAPQPEIERLLDYVQQLEGAVFIRNGSEHSASEAAAHMRMKWEKQREKINTAEDFIALCGTKSLVTGERYRIRFKDGTTRDSAEVLNTRLAQLRAPAAAKP